MQWININDNYLDYLRTIEPRIPRSNYGADKYKPFFGTLFTVEDLCYVTQVSHPQERHLRMRQQKDFYKIFNPTDRNHLLAVVNLNYMFPVPQSEISQLFMKDIDQYRSFSSSTEKSQYIDLLNKELISINSLSLNDKAIKVYDIKNNMPQSDIAQRCLDFKSLENSARDYIAVKLIATAKDN